MKIFTIKKKIKYLNYDEIYFITLICKNNHYKNKNNRL